MQVNNVFKAQPMIYMSDENKCRFSGSLCHGTLRTNWRAMEKQISKDPDKVYKYNLFIEMLQDKLVPKEICQVNVGNRYLAIKQRNNQSVAE